MKIKSLTLFCLATLLIAGCATALKLSAEGEKVRVLAPSEVETCRKITNVNTSVTHIVVGIERPEKTVSKELRVVARNRAAELGGDTIVPLTVIDKGQQTFVVYKCVNPDG